MSTTTKRRKQAAEPIKIAAARPQQERPPDWASQTPEIEYTLEIWFPNADDRDLKIELDRSEYVALKQRLAELRGIPFDAERAA